jgi:hypothetical protein
MISDWRSKFGLTPQQFPFFFVQLAAYTEGNPGVLLAQMRLAQTQALTLPYTGMATAVDLGDPGTDNPNGNIHPRDKQPVGSRLNLVADAIAYGANDQYLGPTFLSASVVSKTPNAVVQVAFEASSIGGKSLTFVDQCQRDLFLSIMNVRRLSEMQIVLGQRFNYPMEIGTMLLKILAVTVTNN